MVKPTNFDQLYPSRFLKAGLLQGKPVPLKITDVFMEELEGEKGKETKAILSFERTPKQLVLCKLNGLCIREMFGPSISAWIGKTVVFFPTDTIAPMKRGEDCIRVWGSPDIAQDLSVPIQLPKRKAFTVTLHRTTPKAAPEPERQPEPEPVIGPEPEDIPWPEEQP